WVECVHGTAHDFPGRTTNWNSHFSNPLLRADWPSSACATLEWTATVRLDRALPIGDHSACTPARLHLDRDPAVILRIPGCHACFRTLAKVVSEKACRVGPADEWNKSGTKTAEGVNDKMSL